jgi:hypothetical protein
MYALPKKPRGIDQLFRSAIELWKMSFAAQLPLALIAGVAAIIERVYVFAYAPTLTPDKLILDRDYWIVFGVCAVINVLAYGAILAQIDFAARGERMSAARAFAIGLRALPTMVASAACYLLAVIVGCLLLILPGVIVSVSLWLFGPAVILERKGIIESLKFSAGMVSGNWWLVAIVQTLGFIAFIGFLLLESLAVELLASVVSLDAAVGRVVEVAAACVAAMVTTPFLTALILEIYFELKLRKAGASS